MLAPPGVGLHASPSASDEVDQLQRDEDRTWRGVAFHPEDEQALLVGGRGEGEDARSLVARWTPDGGLEEVYDEPGPPLVDVDIRTDGTSLVVGTRDTILLGEPGSYRNVWEDNRDAFAEGDGEPTFYGLGAAWSPNEDIALVTGSSLLRLEGEGELEVVHSGEGAFFRSIDFNPVSDYALVEAAIEQDGRAILGTVWRTNGYTNLTEDDNVAIYGRFARGDALLNDISFAPNGTFATFSGRDGAGASFLTWSTDRSACHRHEDDADCHDHRYRYMGASKEEGPVTCLDWHPTGRYAIVGGLDRDTLGYADARMWAPLMHGGADVFDCAFSPTGNQALAVGTNGTVLEIQPGEGPLVRVLDPKPNRLVPPDGEQQFLVGVLDRGEQTTREVTGTLAGNDSVQQATPREPWWLLSANASQLADGEHELHVEASSSHGHAALDFPFLVNDDAFEPSTPKILSPGGLEGNQRDSDGRFTIKWQPLGEAVVYEIEQEHTPAGDGAGGQAGTRDVIEAGSRSNATVRVSADGIYNYRVRAVNSHAAGNWSDTVSIEVELDSDGDGVPDNRDPQPHTPNEWGDPDGDGISTDIELRQCSDPYDPDSTPTGDDDGDGIPNGIECQQGTSPTDPDDPPTDDEPNETANETNETGGDDPQESPSPGLVGVAVAAALAVLAARVRR